MFPQTKAKLTAQELLRDSLRPHIAEVTQALLNKAIMGDTVAIKEFYERAVGKAMTPIEVTQKHLEALTDEQRQKLLALYDGKSSSATEGS